MKQSLIIKLVVWFGWLSYIALAQLELSDALTGSVSFPDVGITCLGNLAAFITSFLRRRLDLENGARDFMATSTGTGLRTGDWEKASVLMLSEDVSDRSIRQFRKYMQNAHFVASILLPYSHTDKCNYTVFPRSKNMTFPKNIKKRVLRSIEYLQKCCACQKEKGCDRQEEGCHCHKTLCHCQQEGRHCYRSVVDFSEVCDALKSTKVIRKKPICICIPLKPASQDYWTKVLIRIFKSKDQEDRGATVNASEAMQKYLDENVKERTREEEDQEDRGATVNASEAQQKYLDENVKERTRKEVLFRTALTIVPRLAEILINVVLTLWFKIDGFSSSLLARRAIRNHVVDSKGVGFPASAFLTSAEIQVNSSAGGSSVCQVLSFRCAFSSIGTLSLIVGLFNLSCSLYWAVCIALHGSAGKWYEIHAPLPSKPRVVVIMSAICFGLLLDSWDLKKAICTEETKWSTMLTDPKKAIKETEWSTMLKVFVMMMIEVAFLIVVGLFFNKGIGRWVYSALQAIVWVKWGVGSWLLGVYSPDYHPEYQGDQSKWVDDGSLVYSSAFLLNAVLAGVRGNWAGVRPAN